MNSRLTILVVDDDEVTRKLLREVLEKSGYSVHLAASGEEAARAIAKEPYPIVLSDIRMIEMDGMAVLREVNKTGYGTAVILMTGFGSMEGAVEAIQEGAFDYVSKPFKIDALKAVVARAAKHWESIHGAVLKEGDLQRGKLEVSDKALIGKSPRIVDVYKTLARASMSSSTVLVIGESGTGKELVARAIHDNSQRRSRQFVAVHCGTVLEDQLESVFAQADGGTLFLDEVAEVSLAFQVRLQRILSGEDHKLDTRLIAATHHDLESLVRAGKFREDLYYRLKVISIDLPPLRQRMEDLPDLVGHFLARYAERNRKQVSHVSDEAMALLKSYSWPGNIRELEHAIERAVAMSNGPILFSEDFPQEISRQGNEPAAGASAFPGVTSLEDMEKAHIMKVLHDVNFNKSKASEALGIDRATLYRKAQRYGIDLRGK